MILGMLGITLPAPVIELAGIVGGANAFIAMLMLGVGFKLSGDKSQIGTIVKILAVRYGVGCILAVVFYHLPLELEARTALIVLAFSPIGSVTPFGGNFDGNGHTISNLTSSKSGLFDIVNAG